jgi:hypothetical protein
MWQGWSKNLYPLVGGTPGAITRELLETFPGLDIALLALGIVEARHGRWPVLIVVALVLLGSHLRYAHALRRNRLPRSVIQYYLAGASLYSAALITSYWKTVHGSIAWKGRKYPAGTP